MSPIPGTKRGNLGLRPKLLLSYFAVIALSAATLILLAQLTAPLFYRQHIEQMVQTFGITNIPEMRRQLASGFIGAVGSAMLLASAATLPVAASISVFVSRRIVEPVRRVSRASTRIAAGHYGERLPLAGDDELGELTRSFNQMAQALEAVELRRRELIGTVAHELRTPLAGMRGFAEGLLDGVFAVEEGATEMIREVRRLERLVDDLSLVTRAEAGVIPVHPVPVPLHVLTERTAATLSRAFERKGLTLSVAAGVEVLVLADPDRLTQVLINLLGNALRHTAHGSVTLTVRAEAAWGVVEVRDTGEGIAPQHLPHIFERFYRVEQSRARDAENTVGAGVGLTVSKHLLQAMQGDVRVDSQPGCGTTFSVQLPLASRDRHAETSG